MQAFQLIMSRQLDDKARVTVWASVWLSYVQPLVAHGENCALHSGKSLTPFRIMVASIVTAERKRALGVLSVKLGAARADIQK